MLPNSGSHHSLASMDSKNSTDGSEWAATSWRQIGGLAAEPKPDRSTPDNGRFPEFRPDDGIIHSSLFAASARGVRDSDP